MACTHDKVRCTDNVFYCLNCGAIVPNPYHKPPEKTGGEKAPKRAVKRTKKGE